MRLVLLLLRKSLLGFWRAKAAVAITFLVPIVLIYLFGHVFGLYRKDTGPTGIPIAVVNASPDPAATQLIDALKAEKAFRIRTVTKLADGTTRPLTEADARAGLKNNDYRFAVILPADFLSAERFGLRVKFLSNPRNEIEAQTVNGILQKTIFSNVPQLLGQSLRQSARHLIGEENLTKFNRALANAYADYFNFDREETFRRLDSADFGFGDLKHLPSAKPPPADPNLRRLDTAPATTTTTAAAEKNTNDVFSKIVKIDNEQVAGKQVANPMAARMVGGYAIMFLLMAVSGSASTLFEEKSTGIFHRLLSSPVRPGHILWARFLFGILLGLVQTSVLFLAGHLFFGLEIFRHAVALLAVSLSAAAACSSFGMLIAAIAPSAAAANGLSTLVVISMSAIGGAWFPVSFMPEYIQSISRCTIVYWAVEGFTDVLWAGQSLFEVMPRIGMLLAITAGVMAVALWRFRKGKLFD
ncbi:MAG: ABC transporter permease [Opitutae bacterium]|nr:ABC transporter permease [Opitutae bacterium]